ncbi:hypothetical protein GF373_15170 [bacterium]|nr:hypothetical protein [bacterium]
MKHLIHFCLILFLVTQAWAFEQVISLDGSWYFTLDEQDEGFKKHWAAEPHRSGVEWREVTVPHTWNIEPGNERYYGSAWYTRNFHLTKNQLDQPIYLEFDAVYRDCEVWINGKTVGYHELSGWTPFQFKIDSHILQEENTIVVHVNNEFREDALPYKSSFDWANDGGIIRSARLRILPQNHIKTLKITPMLSQDLVTADITIHGKVFVDSKTSPNTIITKIVEPSGACVVLDQRPLGYQKNETQSIMDFEQDFAIDNPQLWHFDFPRLYTVNVSILRHETLIHQKTQTFGIRRVECKDGFYYLNGEPMRLMGVEWMPGSDPRYGMASSPAYMRNILEDMKKLNCILTRFHWQQDDAVFDFMDREGMLTQEEVPAWGNINRAGDYREAQDINTTEMINAHYHHPSIYAWGLCNEIGETGKALEFIERGRKLVKELDPHRLQTHASNNLQAKNLVEKAKGYGSNRVEFLEWNDYYESWYGQDLEALKANLYRIKKAFPGKSLIISEYGLCECTPKNPSGDARRIEILKTHTDIYRTFDHVAGAIFFSYNDYRTHIGDKGQGAFQQRVHGVVDLYGARKPSWQALREECSPIKTIEIANPKVLDEKTTAEVTLITRDLENDMPAYTLREYLLSWIAYNGLDQPMGTGKTILPNLAPGTKHVAPIEWPTFEDLKEIKVEIFRPTGYSVDEGVWKR